MSVIGVNKIDLETITRDQLDLLKSKFEVLQGERKAYFDTYEQTKRTNEQLIRDLRERGKELSKQLADAQRKVRQQQSGKGNPMAPGGVGSDNTHVSEDLIKKRMEYDKLRHKTSALRAQLAKMEAELQSVNNLKSLVGNAASAFSSIRRVGGSSESAAADTPEAVDREGTEIEQRVRSLEMKLDRTAVKHDEALSIRATYEQVLRRLRSERVGYDTSLSSIEQSILQKKKELDEVRQIANGSARAMAAAQQALQQARRAAQEARQQQARDLEARRALALTRRKDAALTLARERARRDLLAEVAGDLGVMEERALVQSVEDTRFQLRTLDEHALLIRRKLEVYENAWRRIKDATGVQEMDEVTPKLVAQVEHHVQLTGSSHDNTLRLEGLRGDIEICRMLLQEMRFSTGDPAAGGSASQVSTPNPAVGQHLPRQNSKFELVKPSSNFSNILKKSPTEQQHLNEDILSADEKERLALIRASGLSPKEFVHLRTHTEVLEALYAKQSRLREDFNEAMRCMVQALTGAQHLADSLAFVRASAGAPPLPPVSDETAVAVLEGCRVTLSLIGQRLGMYYKAMGGRPGSNLLDLDVGLFVATGASNGILKAPLPKPSKNHLFALTDAVDGDNGSSSSTNNSIASAKKMQNNIAAGSALDAARSMKSKGNSQNNNNNTVSDGSVPSHLYSADKRRDNVVSVEIDVEGNFVQLRRDQSAVVSSTKLNNEEEDNADGEVIASAVNTVVRSSNENEEETVRIVVRTLNASTALPNPSTSTTNVIDTASVSGSSQSPSSAPISATSPSLPVSGAKKSKSKQRPRRDSYSSLSDNMEDDEVEVDEEEDEEERKKALEELEQKQKQEELEAEKEKELALSRARMRNGVGFSSVIAPSPHVLSKLSISDADILSHKYFNTRVVANSTGADPTSAYSYGSRGPVFDTGGSAVFSGLQVAPVSKDHSIEEAKRMFADPAFQRDEETSFRDDMPIRRGSVSIVPQFINRSNVASPSSPAADSASLSLLNGMSGSALAIGLLPPGGLNLSVLTADPHSMEPGPSSTTAGTSASSGAAATAGVLGDVSLVPTRESLKRLSAKHLETRRRLELLTKRQEAIDSGDVDEEDDGRANKKETPQRKRHSGPPKYTY